MKQQVFSYMGGDALDLWVTGEGNMILADIFFKEILIKRTLMFAG